MTRTHVVAVEYWRGVDATGVDMRQGGYLRLNHCSIKPGAGNEWVDLETTYWKPFIEAWNKQGGKAGWGVWFLEMPGGDNLPYNALTADFFDNWHSMMNLPLDDLWQTVHPHTSVTCLMTVRPGVLTARYRSLQDRPSLTPSMSAAK